MLQDAADPAQLDEILDEPLQHEVDDEQKARLERRRMARENRDAQQALMGLRGLKAGG